MIHCFFIKYCKGTQPYEWLGDVFHAKEPIGWLPETKATLVKTLNKDRPCIAYEWNSCSIDEVGHICNEFVQQEAMKSLQLWMSQSYFSYTQTNDTLLLWNIVKVRTNLELVCMLAIDRMLICLKHR